MRLQVGGVARAKRIGKGQVCVVGWGKRAKVWQAGKEPRCAQPLCGGSLAAVCLSSHSRQEGEGWWWGNCLPVFMEVGEKTSLHPYHGGRKEAPGIVCMSPLPTEWEVLHGKAVSRMARCAQLPLDREERKVNR